MKPASATRGSSTPREPIQRSTIDTVATLGIPGLKSGDPVTWGVPNISLNGDGFSGIGDKHRRALCQRQQHSAIGRQSIVDQG
jgi:hypothetical protein